MAVRLTNKSNIANMLATKQFVIGESTYATAKVVEGSNADAQVEFMGVRMSFAMAYALLAGVSSLTTNPITDLLMNRLAARYQNLSKEIIGAGVQVGVTTGGLMILDEQHNFRKEAVFAALGGDVIGEYIDNLMAPLFGAKSLF